MDERDTEDRRNGRPRKVDGPRVPYDELDRILVFGEVVQTADGGTTVIYPSYRDLGHRYGVAHSLIAQFSRKHDCQRRRREAKARVDAKTEQKIVELRATAFALSKDDALRMIDTYLLGFEKALTEERVRFDNPADFNTMLRLKEFVMGGADSRQEIHAALSLEDIQARHQRMMRSAQQAWAEERGEIITVLPVDVSGLSNLALSDSAPPPLTEDATGELPGQFLEPVPVAASGHLLPLGFSPDQRPHAENPALRPGPSGPDKGDFRAGGAGQPAMEDDQGTFLDDEETEE